MSDHQCEPEGYVIRKPTAHRSHKEVSPAWKRTGKYVSEGG